MFSVLGLFYVQLFIIDGEQLRNNPIHVMHKLQQFVHIQPYFDYSQHLR